jgi:hypothetical protein
MSPLLQAHRPVSLPSSKRKSESLRKPFSKILRAQQGYLLGSDYIPFGERSLHFHTCKIMQFSFESSRMS